MFLDVQMPKITGLELVEVLDKGPFIIFVTAFDEYAIKAFELNAVDYLLKPFSIDRINHAVEKAYAQRTSSSLNIQIPAIDVLESTGNKLNRIVIKNGNELIVLQLNDIVYFEAEADYVMIHTLQNKFLKQHTMLYFETHLPANQFVRIHRSYIVNAHFIEKLEPYDKDSYMAVLVNKNRLKISRTGYKRLREVMNF